MSLIRCCGVGVCPALSAGPSFHDPFPSCPPLLLQFGCATRAGASAKLRALFVGPSIDMTCSNAQFSVLHCLVVSAFEHAACRCDTTLVIWHPMLALRTTPFGPKCPLDLSFLSLRLGIPAVFIDSQPSFPC